MYDTGNRQWRTFQKWPPQDAKTYKTYLGAGGTLSSKQPQTDPTARGSFTEFVSDPANPVPYRKIEELQFRFTPREFMTDDQRFASARPDVLVFQTPPLAKPMTSDGRFAGPPQSINITECRGLDCEID